MTKRKRVNDMKYHYTYRITNIKEGMYYYGVHSCDCLPEEEIGITYFSSSKRAGFVEHQKGRIVINNGILEKRIFPEQLDEYNLEEWKLGRRPGIVYRKKK